MALVERIGITAKAVEKQMQNESERGALTDRTRADIGRWSKKRIDFLEGAQFAACLFHCVSKKRLPIHSYRISEQHTDR